MILASVLFCILLLPLSEDAYLPVVWNMALMLWNVFMNSEDLASAPYSSTRMNANFLSLFLNVVTKICRMSRVGCLLLDGNSKGYEVAEYIAIKVKLNPRMLLTLKTAKSIWSIKPGSKFDTSMVVSLVILSALVKRKIGQGYSKSWIFYRRTSMSTFIFILFRLAIDTWPNHWYLSWEICFDRAQTMEQQHSFFFGGWLWRYPFENSLNCFGSGKVISNNNLEGQKSYNVK